MKQDPTVVKSKRVFHSFLISMNQMMFEAGTAEMLFILRKIIGIKNPEARRLKNMYDDYQREFDSINAFWTIFPGDNEFFNDFRKYIEEILRSNRSEAEKLDKLSIKSAKNNIQYLKTL